MTISHEERLARIAARRAALAGKFVIRSMSTTDYTPTTPVRPYHIYLKPAHERSFAYWAQFGAQIFDSAEEAQAEADRIKLSGYDIAPADGSGPTFWEIRDTKRVA